MILYSNTWATQRGVSFIVLMMGTLLFFVHLLNDPEKSVPGMFDYFCFAALLVGLHTSILLVLVRTVIVAEDRIIFLSGIKSETIVLDDICTAIPAEIPTYFRKFPSEWFFTREGYFTQPLFFFQNTSRNGLAMTMKNGQGFYIGMKDAKMVAKEIAEAKMKKGAKSY